MKEKLKEELQTTHIKMVRTALVALLKKMETPGSPRFSQRIDPGSSADFALRILP